jgi:maltose O-acetyltransferase
VDAVWAIIVAVGNRCRALYWRGVYAGYRRRYDVSDQFRFNGYYIQLYGEGRIELGKDSYVGEFSTIQSVRGNVVRVGEGCMISHNVRIYSETTEADCDFLRGEIRYKCGDVIVGAGVWVGANVFIGPGIEIGADSVIGANSVVTHSVPAGEIWGGVPARRIRAKRR